MWSRSLACGLINLIHSWRVGEIAHCGFALCDIVWDYLIKNRHLGMVNNPPGPTWILSLSSNSEIISGAVSQVIESSKVVSHEPLSVGFPVTLPIDFGRNGMRGSLHPIRGELSVILPLTDGLGVHQNGCWSDFPAEIQVTNKRLLLSLCPWVNCWIAAGVKPLVFWYNLSFVIGFFL